jgi:hypothetical protein
MTPLTDLFADPERTAARISVYGALQPPFLSYDEPRAVKLEALRVRAKIGRRQAAAALAWLIRRGYLELHHRGHRGMVVVTLTRELRPAAARSA